jgi:hypothetical protein
MVTRSLLLALAALALGAPAAHARTLGDEYYPSFPVRVTAGAHDTEVVHFGPSAVKRLRRYVGRVAHYQCAHGLSGNGSNGGELGDERLTHGGSRLSLFTGGARPDLCAITSAPRRDEPFCMPVAFADPTGCVRVAFALTDAGRTLLDAKQRALELFGTYTDLDEGHSIDEVRQELGSFAFALPAADAAPPRGKVGLFSDANGYAVAVVLRDGTRHYVTVVNGVFSTNEPTLMGPHGDAFSLLN